MRFSKAATRTGPTCRGTISLSHGMSEHASIDPPSDAETANPERIRVEGWKLRTCLAGCLRPPRRVLGHCVPGAATSWISCSLETTRSLHSPRTPESTRSLRSQRSPETTRAASSMTSLALGPHYRARLGTFLRLRPLCLSCTSIHQTDPTVDERKCESSGPRSHPK